VTGTGPQLASGHIRGSVRRMASRGRVYLETTVISYLAARLSRDLRVAAHQQVTSDWWATRRVDFEVFVSQLVVEEASAGDRDAAARRLAYLEDINLVDLNEASLSLAEKLVADGAVPVGSEQDALHIALAAVHGMTYLLTWNCKHIANAAMRSRITATCWDAGYDAPVICTPEELLEE
jgi:PIN domain